MRPLEMIARFLILWKLRRPANFKVKRRQALYVTLINIAAFRFVKIKEWNVIMNS